MKVEGLKRCLLRGCWRLLVEDFLEYIYKFGVLPGTGMPAFVSFMKYFCTRLATCFAVLLPSSSAIFCQRRDSTSSGGYFRSSCSSFFCSSTVHNWLNVSGLVSSHRRPLIIRNVQLLNSDLSHNSAELDLTRTLRKLSCYECHFRESRESFQTVHIIHNDTIAMC